MWCTDEGHRAAHRRGNPTSLSTPDQRSSMKLISPIRKLRVLRRTRHLSAFNPDRFFLPVSSIPLSAALSPNNPLLSPCRSSPGLRAHSRHTFTPFLPTIELT